MKIFIVERRGIYGRGIVGVFSTYRAALNAYKDAKSKEHDDYHHFDILSARLDTQYELPEWGGNPEGMNVVKTGQPE